MMKRIILIFAVLLIFFPGFSMDKKSLKFRFVRDDEEINQTIPKDCEKIRVYEGLIGRDFIVEKEVLLDGRYIEEITFERHDFIPDVYVILLKLNPEGTRIFAEITSNNIRKCLLTQLGDSYLFNAVILDPIDSGRVSISGISNLGVFKALKENFDCNDNLNIQFDDSDFESHDVCLKDLPKVDLKNPQEVASAFLHYYQNDDPKWKEFVYSDVYDKDNYVRKLQQLREYAYASIDEYDMLVQKIPKPVKKIPSVLFVDSKVIDSSILIQFVKPENVCTVKLKLLVNKKGEYFVAGL
ncbi:MAG: hypothetical protein VZR56_04750 [Treponema sp.]|nr:hypothetical protein [Treponema sp.]